MTMQHVSTHPVVQAAFARSLKACSAEYVARHMKAWSSPLPTERAIGALIRGLADYAEAHKEAHDSRILDDGMLGPAWAEMLKHCRTLLNGELGRFDAGALDAALCDLYTSQGGEQDEL